MFVYRGEKLKEKDYLKEERERHRKEKEKERERLLKRIEESRKKYEEMMNDDSEEMAKYRTFLKDISEFSDSEKKLLVEECKKAGMEVDFDLRDSFLLSMFNIYNNPIYKIEKSIKYEEDSLQDIEKRYQKEFTIALNKSEINEENVSAILKCIDNAKGRLSNINFCIDNDVFKSNDSEVDYSLTKEQMELLIRIDTKLKEFNFPGVLMTEETRVSDIRDLSYAWSLENVINANNQIDDIVNEIKKNKFSPFEAMLYIHKVASNYVYKEDEYGYGEASRVLPSFLNSDKIVCAGYASLVKAIVDKIDIPGLQCSLQGCSLERNGKLGGHCHNMIYIRDDKYSIRGMYVEDACWDSRKKNQDDPRGFAHCLYSVNDLVNFNKNAKYANATSGKRYFNTIVIGTVDNDTIPSIIRDYHSFSEPISLKKYVKALQVVYSKKEHKKGVIIKRIKQDIKSSQENACETFNEKSQNTFVRSMSKSKMKKVHEKAEGPKTRL